MDGGERYRYRYQKNTKAKKKMNSRRPGENFSYCEREKLFVQLVIKS